MQMVGVVSAALTIPLVLQLLNTAYGFGPVTEAQPDALAAPQATLMASVAEGVFTGDLPWTMVYIGMAIGVAIILIDKFQASRGSDFRVPVLAVAVGLYLPFELDSAIMLGGLIAWAVSRYQNNNRGNVSDADFKVASESSNNAGLLFASGLITGEALIGILLAIPVAIYGSSNVLTLVTESFGSLPGLIVILGVTYMMYAIAKNAFKK